MAKNQQARIEDHDQGESQQDLANRQTAAAAAGPPKTAVDGVADGRKSLAGAVSTLQPGRLTPAESAFNRYSVIVDHGTVRDDLERTSFWQHVTKYLRPGDEVRAKCADGSYVAYLIVSAVGPKDVKMQLLNFVPLDQIAPDAFEVPTGYAIQYGGDFAKWRVLRGNVTLKENFEHRSAAQTWLGSHLQSLGR